MAMLLLSGEPQLLATNPELRVADPNTDCCFVLTSCVTFTMLFSFFDLDVLFSGKYNLG